MKPVDVLLAITATITTTVSAAVIPHDQIVALPQTVPSGNVGALYLKYQPRLYRESGCDTYPAVDAEGNTSGGLSPTGSPTGSCLNPPNGTQIYARASSSSSSSSSPTTAIMYAWYWPKDSPSTSLGHRHDWESIVVWLSSSDPTTATILGVAASAHGGYETTRTPSLSTAAAGDGESSPLVRYFNTWPLDHQLGFTEKVGVLQGLVSWEGLSGVVKGGLEGADWGDANVPFIDANFENNLREAAL